jgi:hypothetical protein
MGSREAQSYGWLLLGVLILAWFVVPVIAGRASSYADSVARQEGLDHGRHAQSFQARREAKWLDRVAEESQRGKEEKHQQALEKAKHEAARLAGDESSPLRPSDFGGMSFTPQPRPRFQTRSRGGG